MPSTQRPNSHEIYRKISMVSPARSGKKNSISLSHALPFIKPAVSADQALNISFSYWHISLIVATVGLLYFVPFYVWLLVSTCIYLAYRITEFYRVWDPSWPILLALRQYCIVVAYRYFGFYQTWKFHRSSFRVAAQQEETLLDLIKLNESTEYSKDHKLSLEYITSCEAFVRLHPLTKATDYVSYTERLKNGEDRVMTAEKPSYFSNTSGTIGGPVLIPFTRRVAKKIIQVVALQQYNAQKHIPWEELHRLRPILKLSYGTKKRTDTTASGIRVGGAATNPFLFQWYGEVFTAPSIVYDIEDPRAATYVQLLFALKYRNLGAIDGLAASLVYFALKQLEADWKELVKDIRLGSLNKDLLLSDSVRRILESQLTPDQQRASRLEREFEKGFSNIANRIWPKLRIINCITMGASTIYARYIRDYYARDASMYTVAYAGAEGLFGINLWPQMYPSRFALLPDVNFYEFIPLRDKDKEQPKTLFMEQLEWNHDYELVITTAANLNRYRLGDIVRVVDFYNEIPVVEFKEKPSATLSVRGEQVPENSVYRALMNTIAQMKSRISNLVDYATCENILLNSANVDLGLALPYHAIFVEISPSPTEKDDTADLAKDIAQTYDENLRKIHEKYDELRSLPSLSCAVVYLIKAGGFSRLKDHLIRTMGVTSFEVKMRHILQKRELVMFLLNNALPT
ncbi:hypothetical protein RvY_04615 [Ramazzottius varieornatus]|uniref:GH3 domain-containing protein n=1 Tax=Ramazzottius varieornatus TaxID=947166 RepID=A0A1D1V259_RAMVA|nr:hypothetical protein RvY_04615 [Ramazzottius varieornatus]